jgi:hypothetical protein
MMPLPPVYRLGAIAVGTCIAAGLVLSCSTPAHATVPEPTPVEGWWALPDGGTDTNVTWDQPVADPASLECGVWYQVDLYPTIEALLALQADGFLRNGEDHGIVISWRFVYGGDCPIVTEPEPPVVDVPVTPPTTVDVAADIPTPPAAVAAAPRTLAATGGEPFWLLVPFALLTTAGAALLAHARRTGTRKAS